MVDFFEFMLSLLKEPAIMVGLIAFIGLVAQKSDISTILKGTIKTVMGYLILGFGAGALIGALNNFSTIFTEAFGVSGVIPNNEAIVAIAQDAFGYEMALIMFFAFIVNIILARITPLKYIFLTGHHTMFMSMLVAVILSTAGIKGTILVALGSIIVGSLMVVMPAIAQKYTVKVMGTDQLAMGHFSTLSYVVSGYIGSKFGDTSKSTEDINVPKSLMFLRDTPVAIATTMILFFLLASVFAGSEFVESISGGQNWLVFTFMQSLIFAGGVYIVLQGVKMFIAEIVPAFKGISDKLVPGAKPALDCPMVFPMAPNAVLIGFLSSFSAGLLIMSIQGMMGWTVIVAGVVPHFFVGGASGVYGNAMGGLRGAILGSFTQGICISILPMLLLPVLGGLGLEATTFSDFDFGVVGLFLGWIVS
ncbi:MULTISPECIES: PTS ascorbate transporter subunit IIC [Photobacterium]|jgi:PTS system ascorbate-specific IIC component|uniref:PTS ascorbate transporter subunit IIC n=1 Tax=Photobacterium TaxID=657 RepID=UPI0007F89C54|nr:MULTISPECIES: PTS ascorbate transporter subunit IIC [Photobacterium]MCD9481554.1 PTS ascorbate transporter subunit IIC [Photobacterium phosphoreum]MEC6882192.1 PTS ascorbate transporter subunit IIC [Photobacterium piscicola]OBU39696.1 PTS ascorbate transporter subunit IIC [Photobacterium phosphoreum]PSU37369.1 PTS ascorbate transporter subunit IIC [Photobacterium phosphoreum]PSU61470.1 PTS ascorbate transporter subunit IIC [Photobacterium phosphoreum]